MTESNGTESKDRIEDTTHRVRDLQVHVVLVGRQEEAVRSDLAERLNDDLDHNTVKERQRKRERERENIKTL